MKWYDYAAVSICLFLVILIWSSDTDTNVAYVDVACDVVCTISLPDGNIYIHESMIDETLQQLQVEYWEYNQIFLVFKTTTKKEE